MFTDMSRRERILAAADKIANCQHHLKYPLQPGDSCELCGYTPSRDGGGSNEEGRTERKDFADKTIEAKLGNTTIRVHQ